MVQRIADPRPIDKLCENGKRNKRKRRRSEICHDSTYRQTSPLQSVERMHASKPTPQARPGPARPSRRTAQTTKQHNSHLFHNGFENGDLQSLETTFHCHPFEEIVMHVRCGSVQSKSKEDGSSSPSQIVLFQWWRLSREGWDQLGHGIADTPQTQACDHFRENRCPQQLVFVPLHKS